MQKMFRPKPVGHGRTAVALAFLLAAIAPLTSASAQTPRTIGGRPVVQVATGGEHSCALVASGEVWCWGRNNRGQLGNNSFSDSEVPVRVVDLTAVTQISLGQFFSCALRRNGRVFCWGSNANSALGVDPFQTPFTAVPVRVTGITDATQIATGAFHGCLVRATGRAFCWGLNGTGQLGDDSTVSRFRPARVLGSRNNNVVQVGAGENFSCLLRDTGRVFCWGSNAFNELGDGTTNQSLRPVPVAGLSAVTQISVGYYHSCARRSNGRVWCWGYNDFGALGNGTTGIRSRPAPVRRIVDAVSVAVGGVYGTSCVVRANRRTLCWGANTSGQLGTDNRTDEFVTVPVRLMDMDNAEQIAIGGDHACGTRRDGTAWCWGENSRGQLGDGTETLRHRPVRVISP